jgi:hypothetical protein
VLWRHRRQSTNHTKTDEAPQVPRPSQEGQKKNWKALVCLELCTMELELSLNILCSFLSKYLGLSNQSLPLFDGSGVYPE